MLFLSQGKKKMSFSISILWQITSQTLDKAKNKFKPFHLEEARI